MFSLRVGLVSLTTTTEYWQNCYIQQTEKEVLNIREHFQCVSYVNCPNANEWVRRCFSSNALQSARVKTRVAFYNHFRQILRGYWKKKEWNVSIVFVRLHSFVVIIEITPILATSPMIKSALVMKIQTNCDVNQGKRVSGQIERLLKWLTAATECRAASWEILSWKSDLDHPAFLFHFYCLFTATRLLCGKSDLTERLVHNQRGRTQPRRR